MRLGVYLLPFILAKVYAVYYGKYTGILSCSFKTRTGWCCPGCGGQRGMYELMQGGFLKALQYNALLPVYVVLLYWCYIVLIEMGWFKDSKLLSKLMLPSWMGYAFLGLILIYMLVRNMFPSVLGYC